MQLDSITNLIHENINVVNDINKNLTNEIQDSNIKEIKTNEKEATKEDKKLLEKISKRKSNIESLESFLQTLDIRNQRIIRNFIDDPAYEHFISYLQKTFSNKSNNEIIHKVNILGFKVKEDFTLRFNRQLKDFKKDEIIHIAKHDPYTVLFLKHAKLERLF